MNKCPVCLNNSFLQSEILKDRLISEWELVKHEVDYINKQQGFFCKKCKSNLRSMTLAEAIMRHFSYKGKFQDFFYSTKAKKMIVLEINEAGHLHEYLVKAKKYTFAEYPEFDIQKLPFADKTFDMIVHSDTLEHVQNSETALKECYRVLKDGGALFYTIPIIFGRMTRSRDHLPNSYHGSQDEFQGVDYKVWTEYGADFWVELVISGFSEVKINTIDDLSSIAIIAAKVAVPRKNLFQFTVNKQIFRGIKNKIKKIILSAKWK